MFGYIRADTPYLYIKDDILYKAAYCGVCKGIGKSCGALARMGLTYDVAFLSVLLHNILGEDFQIEKSHCVTHCIRARKMAAVDALTQRLGAFNTLLVYYKCTDDILDGDKGRGKRWFFKKGYKRAKKQYPELEAVVRKQIALQQQTEKAGVHSADAAADPSASMLADVSDYILGEKATEYTRNLFYAVGKWVYLIDALDDYDKDVKKGSYNPFVLSYGKGCRAELLTSEAGKEVAFIFDSLFADVRENLPQISFKFNHDLTDNILLRGLPMMTKLVMQGKPCKSCEDKSKKK